MWRRNLIKVGGPILVFGIAAFGITPGISQERYPQRPITMVVPWGPGMGDTMTRAVCKVAEKKLGQPVVVENKAGATGAIGTNYVLKSKPDGYTLAMLATSSMWIAPHMTDLPYNVLADVTDICAFYRFNHGLAVRSDAPWKTYEEFIKYARENPGKIRYSTAGAGTSQHIIMERIAIQEGTRWSMVPFKSGPEAIAAVLGGHTDAVAQGSMDVVPHIRAGKLRLLLILNDSRWPDLPQIPHIREKGYDFYTYQFNTFGGPAGLPESIRQKLEDVFRVSIKDPSFVELAQKFGVEIQFIGGKEYAALWKSKYEEMGKVVKALGLGKK